MKPRKPLTRTALKPPTLKQVRAWQSKPRKALPRATKRIAQRGRKTKREKPAWDACKAAVKARSGGWCEGNVPGVCPPHEHRARDVHHLDRADRDRGTHDPDRCRDLCRPVHAWVHDNPADARRMGLLLRSC